MLSSILFLAALFASDPIIRPTFVSCGLEFPGAATADVKVECRPRGTGDWRAAPEFVYFDETKTWRGSLLGLTEDTAYEVRISADGQEPRRATFRTWASEVPIGETIEIDPATAAFPIVVNAKGRADGWVRYTLRNGTRLVNETANDTLCVSNAAYVLLDDLTLVGGGRSAVTVRKSHHVRLRNCDISGWGRTGPVAYDRKARHIDSANKEINFDGAINIGKGAIGAVVERCYVHDPRGRANSWFYSHPAGPEAVMMEKPDYSTVIRYCDFVGSDAHRFNDAVEGAGNFKSDGGFNRDADIYGNFMVYCNDDCIELDGGQRNVRCFGNRFESALCGVSIQGCMMSPVYVDDNLFSGMCDEFGLAGQTVKTGGGQHGKGATAFLRGNLFAGRGSGIQMRPELGARLCGNSFDGRQSIRDLEASPRSTSTDDRLGVSLALDGSFDHPRRPVGFTLSRGKFEDMKGDFTVTATATSPDPVVFEIRQPAAMDWFTVTPATGSIRSGRPTTFSVRLNPDRMKDRRWYRGAFLVRTPDGLSRPVTFTSETDYVSPIHLEHPGETALFVETGKTALGEPRTYEFEVVTAGRYYFLLHATSETNAPRVSAGVDDEPLTGFKQEFKPYASWIMLSPGGKFGNTIRFYDLQPGKHRVTVAGPESVTYDALVLTDAPRSFEPR